MTAPYPTEFERQLRRAYSSHRRNAVRRGTPSCSRSSTMVRHGGGSEPCEPLQMRERLRKVANLQPGFGVVFFAAKAEIVTQCEQTVQARRSLLRFDLAVDTSASQKLHARKTPSPAGRPSAPLSVGYATPNRPKPVRAQWQ